MKLVLIDRDGVINDELPNYVKSVEELIVYDAALEGIALLTRQGFTPVVITNQSVVGRGIITMETLNRIHGHMGEKVGERGGRIEEVFACTDHPDRATYRRKPAPGMLIEAMRKYDATPESTPFIGDAITDMEAAMAAKCPRYLVMTGKGQRTLATLPDAVKPVTTCADLLDAAHKIVKMYG